MRITVLMEDTSCRADLRCEHGLSLLIETAGKTILFDAGQSGAFADNAGKLGIDLKQVDFAVLSHGHYDHGGGLPAFLEENDTAPIYVRPDAFGQFFNASGKYIGLPPALRRSGRLILNRDTIEIAPGITLHSCDRCQPESPVEPYGLQMMEQGRLIPDDFRHEQYLLIREGERRIVISGCSHRGITNICRWLQPTVLVGGFHFVKLDPEGRGARLLTESARKLLQHSAVYYTGHCTGRAQYTFLKSIMGDRLHSFATGDVIEF